MPQSSSAQQELAKILARGPMGCSTPYNSISAIPATKLIKTQHKSWHRRGQWSLGFCKNTKGVKAAFSVKTIV